MAQETAVEYLIGYMSKNQYFIGNDLLEAFEQAKQMEQTNQPTKMVQQTALMKFMEFLRENHYYISSEMVDKYWELIYWEENYSEQEKQEA